MIRSDKISAGYGGKTVIKDISLQAEGGQLIVLLGPNGCGKSTLLKTMVGILTPVTGHIEINEKQLLGKARAKEMAYLSQTRFAAPSMTVRDVIELGRVPHRGRLEKISEVGQAAIKNAMEKTQVTDFVDRPLSELSGGEQARVLLARALAVDAPILLADEPIAALDPFYQLSMMDILKAEAARGKLVIAALHDLALANQFADQIWLMSAGEIKYSGIPKDVLNSDNLETVFGIKKPAAGFHILSRS